MTRQEQADFVRDLSANVANSIIAQIERGIIPEAWDGRQFRLLLADKHSEWDITTKQQKSAYRKDVASNNI